MNVEKIFFNLRKNGKISKKELYDLGADDDYIAFTLEKELLIQIGDDEYGVGNPHNLLLYGRGLLEEEEYKGANMVFDCAYEADFTDFDVNYQLFYRALKQIKPKRSRIFRHFDIVYKGLIDSGREYDANYYIFLLGNLYGSSDRGKENEPSPFDKYKDKFINLEEEDILLPDSDKFSNYENMIRKNVFSNSYYEVTTMIDNRFVDIKHISFEDLLEKELLLKWLNRKRDVNRILVSCLKENNIEAAKSLLNREDERRNLSMTNEYILKLVNSYLTIKEKNIIPTAKYNGDNTFEAIDGQNYELALKLEENRSEMHRVERESTLHMMLKQMVDLIDSMKPKNKTISNLEVYNTVSNPITLVKEVVPTSLTDREMQSIDSKVKELHNGRSIYLLEPMSSEKRNLIRDYVINMYDDISAFSIGDETKNERRIVLRYKPYVEEKVDIFGTADEAYSLYLEEKYEESAEKYALLLKIGKPRPKTYGRFGKTLLKLHRKSEALDCLKVATILSKEQGDKYDFSELIEKIEFPIERENRKPKVEVNENEFEDKQDSLLTNELINDIIGLLAEGEFTIEDICKKLGLNEDETNYIKLIYARDCYYLGNDSVGDKYLKQVTKSKKSDKVKDLYKEMLVDKNYYHNRYNGTGDQLVFIKK